MSRPDYRFEVWTLEGGGGGLWVTAHVGTQPECEAECAKHWERGDETAHVRVTEHCGGSGYCTARHASLGHWSSSGWRAVA